MSAPSTTRRRWFRFSLRTFLLVITILYVWLGSQNQCGAATALAELAKLPSLESIHLGAQGIDAEKGEYAQPIEDRHLAFAKDLTRLSPIIILWQFKSKSKCMPETGMLLWTTRLDRDRPAVQ